MRPTVNTLNFTSRKRINRGLLRITGNISGAEGYFILDKFDVSKYGFDHDAIVFVESFTGKYGFQRFEIGRLSSLQLLKQHPFASSDLRNAIFRIKVVAGNESGRILGDADNIPVEIGGHPSSLLPIEKVDLDQLVWWLDIDEENGPVLQMNSRFSDSQQIALDNEFRATVMQSVVQQIAIWVVNNIATGETTPNSQKWIKVLTIFGADPTKLKHDDKISIKEFGLKAAMAFTKYYRLYDGYIKALDSRRQ